MSRHSILRILEDSQGHTAEIQLMIPQQPNYEDKLEVPPTVIYHNPKCIIYNVDTEYPIRIQHRYLWGKVGGYVDEINSGSDWRDFLEGVDEVNPPEVLVYAYRCGICHQIWYYEEDPEAEEYPYKPYHCHGHFANGVSRTYHLKRLGRIWVKKGSAPIWRTQRRDSQ